ncbi:alpha/beta hydrolase [Rhizobium oryzicola]|uniref:Alpha/beta hydrolase n=1 Tax=Rhizobium oryzicola TaxID=1232668 RepID=A0ABT8SSK0_9HYPH|nr:alpha/beta hydrolase [Rhizobium oryzicola]MDO1581398.1 alpha/beta hydrolase [Rhizobium oryzicola]
MRNSTRAIWFLSVALLFGSLGSSAEVSRPSAGISWPLADICRLDIGVFCAATEIADDQTDCPGAGLSHPYEGCLMPPAAPVPIVAQLVQARATVPGRGNIYRDIAYGPYAEQKMDIYVPQGAVNAPVLFMVHGGGWTIGSKSSARVVDNKVTHFLPKGFIFISVNNRLLPEADPLQQAQDVAAALAAAQQHVGALGGDPASFVLMGHSAGAHLVSLLAADPDIALRLGAKAWRGTIALDSAAYDVAEIMESQHLRLYDRAFGQDPAYWQRVSPSSQLHGGVPPMLLVCSTKRERACAEAEGFADKAQAVGVRAEVLSINKTHSAINEDLGRVGDYTADVDLFLETVLHPAE